SPAGERQPCLVRYLHDGATGVSRLQGERPWQFRSKPSWRRSSTTRPSATGKKSANAGSSDRSNKASRTAFPRPIRSMSPSRPPPAAIRRENNEPPAKGRRARRPWRPLSIAAETARFFSRFQAIGLSSDWKARPSPGLGKMARKYFGTDGIRGRANGTITPELALKVGQAAGLIFRRGEHRHRVLIGKDTRLSGYMIETALVAGFTSVGMDVFQTGPMPTPCVAMLTRSMRADLGVMISASHNPYDDNGIKLFGPDGFKLSDEIEHKIEELVDSALAKMLAKSADLGRARRIDDGQGRYVEAAKRTLPRNLSLEGLRVVVDCANGAAYKVAPQALWELGAEVISLAVEPDGFNINRECGSTEPAALCQKVKEMRADIGIALDGDGDRVLIADERGRIVDGDQLLAVIAESWKADGRLAKPGVVATVM